MTSTLTRAEREQPFRMPDAAVEPLDEGPTRTALEILDTGNAFVFVDRDPKGDFPVVDTSLKWKDDH